MLIVFTVFFTAINNKKTPKRNQNYETLSDVLNQFGSVTLSYDNKNVIFDLVPRSRLLCRVITIKRQKTSCPLSTQL